jgi:hypothetical protein
MNDPVEKCTEILESVDEQIAEFLDWYRQRVFEEYGLDVKEEILLDRD